MKKTIKDLINDIFSMEMIEYMAVGVFTVIIDVGTFEIAYYLLQIPSFLLTIISHIISWIVSTTFAFYANKYFVFKSKHTTKKHFLYEMSTFYGTRLFSLAFSMVLIVLMINVGHWTPFWSKVLVNILVIISNYIFAKLLIFKRKEEKEKVNEDSIKDELKK